MASKVLMVVGIAVLVIVIYFLLPKDLLCPSSPNLRFSQKECAKSPDYSKCAAGDDACRTAIAREFFLTHVSNQTWINENTLRIEAKGVVNCDAQVVCPRYEIQGDSIVLKFGEVYNTPFMAAACICPHDLTYEISGLEKKDYQISIEKE